MLPLSYCSSLSRPAWETAELFNLTNSNYSRVSSHDQDPCEGPFPYVLSEVQAVAVSLLGPSHFYSVRIFHLWCTNAWIPVADCTTFKCLTSTEHKKLFLPQAEIMIPDSVWSSVERRALLRISTSCSCTSDLAFPKPVSPAACWFRGVNCRGQGAVMRFLLNSGPFVSPTWKEDTGQFKWPLNHLFLQSDSCSALEIFVKSSHEASRSECQMPLLHHTPVCS